MTAIEKAIERIEGDERFAIRQKFRRIGGIAKYKKVGINPMVSDIIEILKEEADKDKDGAEEDSKLCHICTTNLTYEDDRMDKDGNYYCIYCYPSIKNKKEPKEVADENEL